MTSDAIDVTVRNLSHTFPGAPPVPALRDVSFGVEAGAFVSVVGPSGCGKSTLLRLLAGLMAPTEGEILLAGQSPDALGARKGIGWMSQKAALLPWRTVLDNVRLPLEVNRQPEPPAASPEALLSLVSLTEFADAYPATLSGGMQQRVALARTLAIDAPLWLMDEPFAALDELTREGLAAEMLAIWQRFRPTVLWVTHHIPEAVRLSDRILVLSPRPGRVVGQVQVDLDRPRDELSRPFLGVVRDVRDVLRRRGE